MRIQSHVLLLFGLAVLPLIADARAGEFKLEPGFTLLFNGKNLDGWQTAKVKKSEPLQGKTEAFKGRFKVEDGKLIYDPKAGGDRYIETVKEFAKDIHFKFDFKPGPACNNDILFRGKKFDIIPGKGETKNVKEGEWYTFELVAVGDKIEHKIDGDTVRTTKNVKAIPSAFMLRAEFGAIQIKNIRAKE